MPLLLGISDTDHAPSGTCLVGEDICDLPRIHGVLADQISGIVDAEVLPIAGPRLITHLRVIAPSRDVLGYRLRPWVGEWSARERVKLRRRRRCSRCGNLPRDDDVQCLCLIVKRHWVHSEEAMASCH